jgi:hypothetical protein
VARCCPNEPKSDFVADFIANAQYDAGAGEPGHAAKLAAETAVITQRAEAIYKGIAAKVTGASPWHSLAKNTPAYATQKVVRLEVTKYATTEVVAEIGEHGEVIRTYARDAA